MTLVEFLTARLDEDERVARDAMTLGMFEGHAEPLPQPWWAPEEDGGAWERTQVMVGAVSEVARTPDEFSAAHIARHDPARVLREVEAKRDILNEWAAFSGIGDNPGLPDDPALRLQVAVLLRVIARLALPYADHPDYDESWRP